MNRDTGIRNLFPGIRFDSEVEEDLRSQMEIRKRLEQMTTPEPADLVDLRFAPIVDLKPTKMDFESCAFTSSAIRPQFLYIKLIFKGILYLLINNR